MIVAMQDSATEDQIQQVIDRLVQFGFEVHRSTGAHQTVLGGVGVPRDFDTGVVEIMPGVQEVHRITSPYKLAGRNFRPEGTVVKFSNGIEIGGKKIVVMAGPCSVESPEQMFTVSEQIAKAGARVLRGGAFKPRTSPYSFQGLGLEGLKLLQEVGATLGILTVTEVVSPEDVSLVAEHADILQIGARNMQNFPLLIAAGKSGHPTLLKRGPSASIDEFLLAAEYLLHHGTRSVMLCERGVHPLDR